MNRRDIIKGLGLTGLASLLPLSKSSAAVKKFNKAQLGNNSCILIPQETAGPYPFDLSSNSAMFRQDITEGNAGIPLTLTLTVVNINDGCSPIANARVDVWHCNKDGYYSEYNNQPGYLGTQNHTGETFFRGIQMTDSNGQVQFITIYPGWYNGRATHIHFQVFLNSVLSATSQAAFNESLTASVYNTSLYSAHGQNTTTNSSDNVFSDSANTQYEMLDIVANTSTGGYDASLTIGIDAPITGIINLEPETGGQFKLNQNFPNPFVDETTIPFTLNQPASVKIELFDLSGKKMMNVLDANLNAGAQSVGLKKKNGKLVLAAGSYLYQITTSNHNGTFRQCKVLTVE